MGGFVRFDMAAGPAHRSLFAVAILRELESRFGRDAVLLSSVVAGCFPHALSSATAELAQFRARNFSDADLAAAAEQETKTGSG